VLQKTADPARADTREIIRRLLAVSG